MTKPLFLEYIWFDGRSELRSKTRVMYTDYMPKPTEDNNNKLEQSFPMGWNWNYDGSSCYQAEGKDSEILLKPVKIYRDPFIHSTKYYLVLCETFNSDGSPTQSNKRHSAIEIFNKNTSLKPKYGIEHEFFVIDNKTGYPLGYVPDNTEAQGKYYCSVGAGRAYGRNFLYKAMIFCERSGLNITGCNFEVAPGQMEIQICNYGIDAADDSTIMKYILSRLGEDYDYSIDYSAKPLKGDWNGSGCHVNFSTVEMMDYDKGFNSIMTFIQKLKDNHFEHIEVYGDDNNERLTGHHETSDMNSFSFGVANRTASIRIPRETDKNGYGYIEDRRPSGSANMYVVTSRLFETYCKN